MTKPSTTTGNHEPPSGGRHSDRADVLFDHQKVEVEFNPDGVRLAAMSRTSSGSRFAAAAALTMAVVGAGVAAAAVAFVGNLVGIAAWLSFPLSFVAMVGVVSVYLLQTRPPKSATLWNRETGEAEAEVPVRTRPRVHRPRTGRKGKRFKRS